MSSPIIQLLVLAGIAVFLILRLRDVLGTREGFEKPSVASSDIKNTPRKQEFKVIEGGPDGDITDHAEADSNTAKALAAMKTADSTFNVTEFLGGARGAYEMILMGFEAGDLAKIKPFLSSDVYESFASVVSSRESQGLSIEATFIGIRELKLVDAEFDRATKEGEVSVRFVGELTSVVRDKAGDVVEGNPNEVKRQKDIWTFSRVMDSDNPNWQLVATGG